MLRFVARTKGSARIRGLLTSAGPQAVRAQMLKLRGSFPAPRSLILSSQHLQYASLDERGFKQRRHLSSKEAGSFDGEMSELYSKMFQLHYHEHGPWELMDK
mmetsp:Transcript_33687/g.52416  ORF Transcript_33687/g.52416 Transcript_33687/m.52416 type:complete len:102 (-) Transcript_33687:2606-2911(-)